MTFYEKEFNYILNPLRKTGNNRVRGYGYKVGLLMTSLSEGARVIVLLHHENFIRFNNWIFLPDTHTHKFKTFRTS